MNTPIENILREIAAHAELNPDWLEKSGLQMFSALAA
jgi:hypothetical protein